MYECEKCGKKIKNISDVHQIDDKILCDKCAYSHIKSNNRIINDKWATILKVFSMLVLICGIIASVVFGLEVIDDNFIRAVIIIVLGILTSIAGASLLMTISEIGINIASIRYNNENKK